MLRHFSTALVLTLLVEVPLLLVIAMRWLPLHMRPSSSRVVLAGFLASSATLPYLWFIVPEVVSPKYYLAGGELIVIVAEAMMFSFVLEWPLLVSAIASTVCNAASCLFGLAFFNML